MPKGIYSNPKERAEKISKALKTGKFFNCLICCSKFWRKQYAIKKGQNKFCSKDCYFKWQKGRNKSEAFRVKCKEARLRKAHLYTIDKKNRFWRNSNEYKEWRKSVFRRDNWTCKKCGARSKKNCYVRIEAHHIKPFALFPELRFVIDNGVTLCKPCHDKEPKGKEILCIK